MNELNSKTLTALFYGCFFMGSMVGAASVAGLGTEAVVGISIGGFICCGWVVYENLSGK